MNKKIFSNIKEIISKVFVVFFLGVALINLFYFIKGVNDLFKTITIKPLGDALSGLWMGIISLAASAIWYGISLKKDSGFHIYGKD